ncbi:hypothetical protein [Luteimonas terricola]|uniref:Glycosyltransferase RgtA/B/C/D-like domain-containing protein n=1 Tax=Luteimonas terricola TaxID=645597 RepID=A0ABQ2EJ28_9GAMM|nr:hypothetical protein [Luteimonas terricola]GGK13384.1 hypothetical protein GCM10011394_23280 [Luteimonas terricola]
MIAPHIASPTQPKEATTKVSFAWIAVSAFIVFLFDPGIMSNDSIASLQQARSFEFNDWHPPLMAVIWSVLDRIISGSAGMLLAQAMLFAYACSSLCAYAFPNLSARFPRWLVTVAFSLFPPVMTLTGMIWKDVWASTLLLLALAHLFRMRNSTTAEARFRQSLIVMLFCLAAIAFRHNAMAATAGLLAGATYLQLSPHMAQWGRLLAASTIGVIIAFALFFCISFANSLIATPAHPTTAIYLYDIAGIIVYSGDAENAAALVLADPAEVTDEPEQFLNRIYSTYTPSAAGRVIRTSKKPHTPFSLRVDSLEHDAEGVQRIHRGLVKKYPIAYLKHRTQAFVCLLRLCNSKMWVYRSYVMNREFAFPETLNPESWQYAMRKVFLSPRLAPIYHPAFWLFITLVGGAIGLVRVINPGPGAPSLLVFMGLSSVGLAFSLFFTSPIESFRYMHWTILVGWVMAGLAAETVAARPTPSPH